MVLTHISVYFQYPLRNVKDLVDKAARWQWIALAMFLSAVAFMAMFISVWVLKTPEVDTCHVKMCSDRIDHHQPFAFSESWVFKELSGEEIDHVENFLYSQKSLALVRPEDAQIDRNFIHTIELKLPRKHDVIEYLDKMGPAPHRKAKVYIFKGQENPPVVEEYEVGNLPNVTYARLFNTTARQTRIPYHIRPFSTFEFKAIYKYIIAFVSKRAGRVLQESYGATPMDCGTKCLRFSFTPISSGFLADGKRKAWFWFAHDVEFYTLHPLDFQFLVDMTSSHPESWTIENIWYSKQIFPSIDIFLQQYDSNIINKTRIPFPSEDELLFSSLMFRHPAVPDDQRRPPVQYEPDGPRYTVKGNQVSYMSWLFSHRISPTAGVQLLDVRFQNERILYELSMQEITVLYSGYSPAASMLYYADSAGLFGTRFRGLLPGVDCPERATMIDSHLFAANEGGRKTFENALCVFEHNNEIPLRRHRAYGRSGAFYGGLVTTTLIVRSIISVINYDYSFDIMFYSNGGMEIKVSLTGYLGTTFHYPEEDPYGAHVHKYVSAGIHNHLFHFKVDLDVMGTSNRYETLNIDIENKTSIWNIEKYDWHMQKYFHRELKKTELDAAYKYNFETPKYLLFSNERHKTAEGVPRSFRLHVNSMSKLLLPKNYGFERSVSWGRYQVAVTKHKDDEDTSSSMFAMWDATDPVVNFQKYLDDDENIVDEVKYNTLI